MKGGGNVFDYRHQITTSNYLKKFSGIPNHQPLIFLFLKFYFILFVPHLSIILKGRHRRNSPSPVLWQRSHGPKNFDLILLYLNLILEDKKDTLKADNF
jgi:hypothetical protein